MPARPPAPPKPPPPPGRRFRTEIEKATDEGASLSDLLLQLTRSDASKLRRDNTISTDDIDFSSGAMTYLGVKVVEGETPASILVNLRP